jgi:serine/threonine protein kinase
MTEKQAKPGLVLAGRYRLESKLGEGGMGTVWKAEHLVLCAPVAVKVLDRDVSRDQEAHDRFIREARSAAALRSPHVVQTLDYGIDEGFPFIAMELLEGETLAERLSRQHRLNPVETARIITHVARAVGRAHEAGIIHRDLKPENVFIVKNEDAEISKVLDFGVAKVETANLGPKGTRTRTGSLLGTPFYMSPEQAQGNKTIDARSDLWSLGVMAFECLTGKRPFESEGLGDLVLQICVRDMPKPSAEASLPPRYDEWFEKACARDPENRFQTAKELAEALREVVGHEARETMATFGDDDMPSAPVSVVIRSDQPASSVTAKTISSAVDPTADTDELATTDEPPATEPIGARKPSLTVRQFGTTQSSVPQRSSRAALYLIGGVFLVAGVGLGLFLVNGGQGFGLGQTAGSGVPPEPPPTTSQVVPGPSAEVEDTPARDAAQAAEEVDAGSDAAADASGDAPSARVEERKNDEEDTPPPIRDASTDRDWGKTEEPFGGAGSAGDAGKSVGTPSSDAGKTGEPKPEDKQPNLPPPPAPLMPDR